jgi:hypothetical protein
VAQGKLRARDDALRPHRYLKELSSANYNVRAFASRRNEQPLQAPAADIIKLWRWSRLTARRGRAQRPD